MQRLARRAAATNGAIKGFFATGTKDVFSSTALLKLKTPPIGILPTGSLKSSAALRGLAADAGSTRARHKPETASPAADEPGERNQRQSGRTRIKRPSRLDEPTNAIARRDNDDNNAQSRQAIRSRDLHWTGRIGALRLIAGWGERDRILLAGRAS